MIGVTGNAMEGSDCLPGNVVKSGMLTRVCISVKKLFDSELFNTPIGFRVNFKLVHENLDQIPPPHDISLPMLWLDKP